MDCCSGMGTSEIRAGLCLRDKETGEWLIGLFDDFAVYDCEYWNYEEIGDKRIIQTKEGVQKEIKLKKDGIVIDGVKHKTEMLTSKYLPDYPVKDESSFFGGILDEEQKTIVRILHKDKKGNVEFGFAFDKPLSLLGQIEINQKTDSLGRAELTMPLAYTTMAMLAKGRLKNGHPKYFTNIILQPGTKILFLVDDANKRIYAMGNNARIVNELLAVDTDREHYPQSKPVMNKSAEEYINVCKLIMDKNLKRLDSLIKKRPLISCKWQMLQREDERMKYSHRLLQQRFNWSKKEFGRLLPVLLANTDLLTTKLPYYTTSGNLNFIFNDYVGFKCEEEGWNLCGVMTWLAEQPEKDKRLQMTGADREMFAKYGRLSKEAEKMHNDEAEKYLYENDTNKVVVKYCSEFYKTNISQNPEMMRLMVEEEIKRQWAILDECNTTAVIRDVQKASVVYKNIETYGVSLSQDVLMRLPKEIHSSYLLKLLTDANQKLADYEKSRGGEQPKVQDNRLLENLTDGKDIFEKIIAPYRGKVIYLDVWGAWCAPCKMEMKNVPALKELLKGKNVVYLYLCNGSSDESLKNNIQQFGLVGENVIHYNLPVQQQSALEKYIGVEGFPTYKLIDCNGRIVPGRCPRPSQPEMVKAAIERLLAD